jgi:plastocyanin
MYMPPSSTASAGSYGSGSTHTVWVAPTQGVLRYVPFALNASVGDTVKFIWGANNHTVTKSSELALCNKTGDAPFASGEQNKTFVCKNNMTHSLYSSRNLTNVFSFSHASCQ